MNADLIAQGLSPLRPELATRSAGRLFLGELKRRAGIQESFAFETTLSGLTYLRFLKAWKQNGYHIKIIFLRLPSPHLAVRRVASRVRQGGHDVPRPDVLRRFKRGLANFHTHYQPLADSWAIYDNSGERPQLLERWP